MPSSHVDRAMLQETGSKRWEFEDTKAVERCMCESVTGCVENV